MTTVRPLLSRQIANPDPDGDNYDFRQYNDYVDNVLDNLIANPDELNGRWADVTFHCIMQEVTANEINEYRICAAKAAQVNRRIYPAFRTYAQAGFAFADTVTSSFWLARATMLETLCAERAADDPRIGIDAESYFGGVGASVEPAESSIVSLGYSESQFRSACRVFLDAVYDLGVFPCIYPIVNPNDRPLLPKFLLETLGPERMEFWWERTFGIGESCRKTYLTNYQNTIAANLASQSIWDKRAGAKCLHRSVIDANSVFCNWGEPMRTNITDLGYRKPWIFDDVRSAQGIDIRPKYGLPAFSDGTTMYSVNDWNYWWELQPNMTTNQDSVGTAATALPLLMHRASSQTSSSLGTPLVADLAGYKLQPGVGDIYGVFRVGALPTSVSATKNNWSYFVQFRIPSTLAATKPLFGQAFTNFGNAQAYYDNEIDAIVWQTSNGFTETLLENPDRDTTIKIVIARNGDTAWKACVNGGSIINLSPGATLAQTETLIIGGGEEVDTFHTNNKIESCIGFTLERLGVHHRTLTDTEMQNVCNFGYPAGV